MAAEHVVSAGDGAFVIAFFVAAFGLCAWAWCEVRLRRRRWVKVPGVDPAVPAKAAPEELLAFSVAGVLLVAAVFALIGAAFTWFLLAAP